MRKPSRRVALVLFLALAAVLSLTADVTVVLTKLSHRLDELLSATVGVDLGPFVVDGPNDPERFDPANGQVTVYVVSMVNSTRRPWQIEQFNNSGLRVQLFDAIMGRDVRWVNDTVTRENYMNNLNGTHFLILPDNTTIPYKPEVTRHTWKFKKGLSFGEIGCAVSHLMLYKKMIAENRSLLIIAEDDMRLTRNTTGILESLARLPPADEFDLAYLNGHGKVWSKKPVNGTDGQWWRIAPPPFGTYGYIITQRMARRVLDNFVLFAPADEIIRALTKVTLNANEPPAGLANHLHRVSARTRERRRRKR